MSYLHRCFTPSSLAHKPVSSWLAGEDRVDLSVIHFRFMLTLPHSAFISAVQVATAATFSAAWLEGLRMALATLEKPDGTLMAPTLMDARLLPALSALLLLGVPALLAGGLKRTG